MLPPWPWKTPSSSLKSTTSRAEGGRGEEGVSWKVRAGLAGGGAGLDWKLDCWVLPPCCCCCWAKFWKEGGGKAGAGRSCNRGADWRGGDRGAAGWLDRPPPPPRAGKLENPLELEGRPACAACGRLGRAGEGRLACGAGRDRLLDPPRLELPRPLAGLRGEEPGFLGTPDAG